jgi:hypothetical protein
VRVPWACVLLPPCVAWLWWCVTMRARVHAWRRLHQRPCLCTLLCRGSPTALQPTNTPVRPHHQAWRLRWAGCVSWSVTSSSWRAGSAACSRKTWSSAHRWALGGRACVCHQRLAWWTRAVSTLCVLLPAPHRSPHAAVWRRGAPPPAGGPAGRGGRVPQRAGGAGGRAAGRTRAWRRARGRLGVAAGRGGGPAGGRGRGRRQPARAQRGAAGGAGQPQVRARACLACVAAGQEAGAGGGGSDCVCFEALGRGRCQPRTTRAACAPPRLCRVPAGSSSSSSSSSSSTSSSRPAPSPAARCPSGANRARPAPHCQQQQRRRRRWWHRASTRRAQHQQHRKQEACPSSAP